MREGEPWGEWLQTSKEDWCGEGARQGVVGEDRPVVVDGVEVDVAQLGRPASGRLIISRKVYNQMRADLDRLQDSQRLVDLMNLENARKSPGGVPDDLGLSPKETAKAADFGYKRGES
jgi:hypothetical protein